MENSANAFKIFIDEFKKALFEEYRNLIEYFPVDKAHDDEHVYRVLETVHYKTPKPVHHDLEVLLSLLAAAVFHEVDDVKLFPKDRPNQFTTTSMLRSVFEKFKNDKTFQNLKTKNEDRFLHCSRLKQKEVQPTDLKSLEHRVEDRTLAYISFVSFKDNGNKTNFVYKNVDYSRDYYNCFVRDADRLEAIGNIGIVRTYEYNLSINAPFFIESTPLARTRWGVLEFLKHPNRYEAYIMGRKSKSMIDHFYDKLLHIRPSNINIRIFEPIFDERKEIMIEFLMKFGIDPTLERLHELVEECKSKIE